MNIFSISFLTNTTRLICGFLLFVLIGCSSENDDQDQDSSKKYPVVQSIRCMDKNGASITYKVKYDIIAVEEISNTEYGEITLKTKWVISDLVDLLVLEECLLKKDSVETLITNAVYEENKTALSRIDSFSIEETAIPATILEYFLSHRSEFSEIDVVAE